MKHPGPSPLRRKKAAELKRMEDIHAMMMGLPVKKKRKGRGKDKGPRQQPEALLRNDIIKALRKRGVVVMRVENSIIGKHNTGMGDLWVFNEGKGMAGWMEIKAAQGILRPNQKVFKDLCHRCNVNYWVVRSVEEALEVILK